MGRLKNFYHDEICGMEPDEGPDPELVYRVQVERERISLAVTMLDEIETIMTTLVQLRTKVESLTKGDLA